eukprot:3374671-Pleurochrysis_carterae.AAC.4
MHWPQNLLINATACESRPHTYRHALVPVRSVSKHRAPASKLMIGRRPKLPISPIEFCGRFTGTQGKICQHRVDSTGLQAAKERYHNERRKARTREHLNIRPLLSSRSDLIEHGRFDLLKRLAACALLKSRKRVLSVPIGSAFDCMRLMRMDNNVGHSTVRTYLTVQPKYTAQSVHKEREIKQLSLVHEERTSPPHLRTRQEVRWAIIAAAAPAKDVCEATEPAAAAR